MNELVFQSQNHFPLSSNQKRLWLMSQRDGTNPAYNIQIAYHIKGKVNYDIFLESIKILFNNQYTMFSVFKQKDGVPHIEIVPEKITIESIDFSHLPAEIRKGKILSFAGEDSRKCFDLEKGPLYRLFLLKEDNESVFFYTTINCILKECRSE